MKLQRPAILVTAAAAALFISGCTVEKTQEGEVPKVKVEGGQMPKYDVKPVDVDVNSTTKTVTVPKVVMTTETVTVPSVDVKPQ